MQKDTKELLTIFGGYTAASIAIVGSIGLMADCSKQVSRTNYDMAACVKEGGEWQSTALVGGDNVGYCTKEEKR